MSTQFSLFIFHILYFENFRIENQRSFSIVSNSLSLPLSIQINGLFRTHQQIEASLHCKMSSPTSIDDLPSEMICELFKHLCPKDLVTCSMVNKRWHNYAGFKVHRLVVANYRVDDKWYHSDRKIEDQELCSSERFSRLANKPLLSNLKHLALCGNPRSKSVEPV